MHELSVTEAILNLALKHAEDETASRITDLYLVIGDLSSVVDDSVQFYWNIIAKDTIAENAILHFKRIHPEIQCRECQLKYTPQNEDISCPRCGSIRVDVIKGKEFYLDAIDIENSTDPSEQTL